MPVTLTKNKLPDLFLTYCICLNKKKEQLIMIRLKLLHGLREFQRDITEELLKEILIYIEDESCAQAKTYFNSLPKNISGITFDAVFNVLPIERSLDSSQMNIYKKLSLACNPSSTAVIELQFAGGSLRGKWGLQVLVASSENPVRNPDRHSLPDMRVADHQASDEGDHLAPRASGSIQVAASADQEPADHSGVVLDYPEVVGFDEEPSEWPCITS